MINSTIIDYDYSERIKELNLNEKLKCHIKINTGMNRLGEKYNHLDKLYKIYENEKLNILGTLVIYALQILTQKKILILLTDK